MCNHVDYKTYTVCITATLLSVNNTMPALLMVDNIYCGAGLVPLMYLARASRTLAAGPITAVTCKLGDVVPV